jgi:hypothetical protein
VAGLTSADCGSAATTVNSTAIGQRGDTNGIPGHVVISQATFEESEGFFEVEKLDPITLHAKPAKNVLPGDNMLQTPPPETKTQVHRYKVVGHLGNMAHRSDDRAKVVMFQPHKPCRVNHEHSAVCAALSVGGGSGTIGRRSRPSSAAKDENERALPPFVSNILGKIQAHNFMDAKERLERNKARQQEASERATANLTSPKSTNGRMTSKQM